MKYVYSSIRSLASSAYFELNKDGELQLKQSFSYGFIDMHTHIGWHYVPLKKVRHDATIAIHHQFPMDGESIDLSHYSALDFTRTLIKNTQKEMIKSAFAVSRAVKSYTPENLLREMKLMNVEKSAVLAIDMFSSKNSKAVLRECAKTTSLVPFISIHPKSLTKKIIFSRLVRMGARGLKIHPGIQMVKPNHPGVIQLCQMAAKHTIPVIFHCGYSPLQPKFQQKFAYMDDFESLIKAVPDACIILGHSGIDQFERVAALGAKYPNVYAELSGQPPSAITYLIKKMGTDRLLFGTDWPIYPLALPLVKVLLATEKDKVTRKKILHDNAKALLHLT